MIGQTISHYKILEKIGEGGMGIVYKAHDTKLDRTVALKFLPNALVAEAGERERFYHEAKAASALMHPNVAVIFEINEHEGKLFLAMELVEGKTLKKMIEGEPTSLKKVLDISIQACEGLAAAHEKGIVHRDIKSDNIMITAKGQVKIMDFGLAKIKGSSKLTMAGSTIGTAAYMSPEQARSEEVDQRSDIFSFGVVCYEMLAGRLPFKGEHHAALMYSLINEEAPPVARFNNAVTPDIERIVSKALAKEAGERYQHIDDMLADLRRERKNFEYAKAGTYQSSMSQAQVQPAVSKRGLTKYFIAGGVAFAVMIGAFFVFNPFGARPPAVVDTNIATGGKKSIAVLPFTNLSDNKEDEYFSDGITEDILTQLSRIAELKVTSRTSAMAYKGSKKSIREIGAELGVSTILEGSIRRAGNKVRIVSQLVDARTDEQIWAETYDRDMKDIFEIQSDVAQKIASALEAKLSPTEKAIIEKKPTADIEAYGHYLRGREYYYRYHKPDNENAIEQFNRALAIDPSYALAYAGLADCYGQRTIKYGFPSAWADSGIEQSEKAIKLDPNLAEGYKSLGLSYGSKGWINRALDAYYKAVERNPNYTPAVGNICILNYIKGNLIESYRWAIKDARLTASEPFVHLERGSLYLLLTEDAESERWLRKSIDLQPDFVFPYIELASMSISRGELDRAEEFARKSLAIEPQNISGLNMLGTIQLIKGEYPSALENFVKAQTPSIRTQDYTLHTALTGKGYSLLKLGRKEEGMKDLESVRTFIQMKIGEGSEHPLSRYELAAVSALEGKKDEAIDWLRQAVDAGWLAYRLTQKDPMLESCRNDQRFADLIVKMKEKVETQRKLVAEASRGVSKE